jgi:hypothetical protein
VLLVLLGTIAGAPWNTTATLAAPLTSSITIPIAGTVTGATESIVLSGTAEIASTFVLDTLLIEPPRELISIKLVKVSGVGLSTLARYVVAGQNVLLRPLVSSDLIEITFPLAPDTPGGTSQARPVLASFTLKFDVVVGSLTGGVARFSTPFFGQ